MKATMFAWILLFSLSLRSAVALEGGEGGAGVHGKLLVPGAARFRDFRLLVQLHAGEGLLSAYCKSDGSFVLPPLPPGVHILTIVGEGGWAFPQVIVDVSSRSAGNVRLSYLDTQQQVSAPFMLKGIPMSHFEVRRPFSLWGFLKSPYGIMIGGMLFAILVFPMLKLDPEEYRQMQEVWTRPQQNPPQITQPARRRD